MPPPQPVDEEAIPPSQTKSCSPFIYHLIRRATCLVDTMICEGVTTTIAKPLNGDAASGLLNWQRRTM